MSCNIIFSWVEIINLMLPEMRKPSETYFLNLPNGSGICILGAGFRKKWWAYWKRSLEKDILGTSKIKTKIRVNLALQFWQKWKEKSGQRVEGLESKGHLWSTEGILKTWRCDYLFNTPWAHLRVSQMNLALFLTFSYNSLGLIEG